MHLIKTKIIDDVHYALIAKKTRIKNEYYYAIVSSHPSAPDELFRTIQLPNALKYFEAIGAQQVVKL